MISNRVAKIPQCPWQLHILWAAPGWEVRLHFSVRSPPERSALTPKLKLTGERQPFECRVVCRGIQKIQIATGKDQKSPKVKIDSTSMVLRSSQIFSAFSFFDTNSDHRFSPPSASWVPNAWATLCISRWGAIKSLMCTIHATWQKRRHAVAFRKRKACEPLGTTMGITTRGFEATFESELSSMDSLKHEAGTDLNHVSSVLDEDAEGTGKQCFVTGASQLLSSSGAHIGSSWRPPGPLVSGMWRNGWKRGSQVTRDIIY